jgi:hypothetical protein
MKAKTELRALEVLRSIPQFFSQFRMNVHRRIFGPANSPWWTLPTAGLRSASFTSSNGIAASDPS